MYGYVRPDRGELKVRDYETFRGVYCGLCHRLRERYGPLARFAVNYDYTFLAMLLSGPEPADICARRCPYHPLRRAVKCLAASPGMDLAADHTVILAYWKLRDGAADKPFLPSLGYRLLAALHRGAYVRASERCPGFASTAETELAALSALERDRCPTVDEPADRFARILRAAADGTEDPDRRRILRELLYHLGRIVYILDAADDLSDDLRDGSYNPLRYRFSLQDGRLSPEDEAELRLSLQHSHNRLAAAFGLLPETPYSPILKNTVFLGLPGVTQAVFSGEWKASKRQRKERKDHERSL